MINEIFNLKIDNLVIYVDIFEDILQFIMNKKNLIVIVGPTAVGKTALTVELALELNAQVLNADSRRVFKELSIGTAKPLMKELKGVQHYFVDDRSITDEFSAGHFEKEGIAIFRGGF